MLKFAYYKWAPFAFLVIVMVLNFVFSGGTGRKCYTVHLWHYIAPVVVFGVVWGCMVIKWAKEDKKNV